jgi:hypothetical protein
MGFTKTGRAKTGGIPVKPAALIVFASLPLLAADWRDDRDWKLNQQETIRRSFDLPGASDPKKLLVDNISGSIHVTGYAGSQVQAVVEQHIHADSNEAMAEARRDIKLDISQQGNFVRLYEDGPFRSNNGVNYRGDNYYGYRVDFDYEIQVPYDTELILKTINHGDIVVKKTTGDYEIHGLNGGIDMDDLSGSGKVHTLNGKVKVTFSRNPVHNTEFKTLNGTVDVYFQPGLNADLHFKKLNGGIYTDFDVTALPATASGGDSRNGKFIYRSDRMVMGRAGKGGPELSFETLNGSIRLHSKTL